MVLAKTSSRSVTFLGGALLLLALTFTAYWPVLHNGFVWDDDRYIEGNTQLLSTTGLANIWLQPHALDQYYPLTFTTFWIEYHFWHATAWPYHLDNLLLHTAAAIVLWRVLARLGIKVAYAAALLFALHPLQVESIAWATERKNVLSALFYLLALAAYFRTRWGRKIVDDGADASAPWHWYALSLLLFIAALLSKSVTSTLPAAILLLVWWKRGRIRLADVLPLVPMFVLGAAMGLLTSSIERHHVGAIGPAFNFSPLERLCIAGRAAWFYLAKLLWPHPLAFIYSRWQFHVAQRAWLALFPAALLIALLALWLLRRRTGRGLLAAALFFLGTLVPALGFFNVYPMRYSFVADHFQYLACIGPIVLAAAIIAHYLSRQRAVILTIGVVGALAVATNYQCRVYHDRVTLWRDTLLKNPNSAMVHLNYGQALFADGDLEAAIAQSHEALQLDPVSAAPYLTLASYSGSRGDWPAAVKWYKDALQHTPDSPEPVLHHALAEPYNGLGNAFAALADQAAAAGNATAAGQYRYLAIAAYQRAIAIIPGYELAMVGLGQVYAALGQPDKAAEQFRTALAVNRDSLGAHDGLGKALLAQGRTDDALAEFRQVLRLQPGNAHGLNNVGMVLAKQGHLDEAIQSFEAALAADPQLDQAHQNLLRALALKHSTGK